MNMTQLSAEHPAAQRVRLLYTAKTHTNGGRDGGSSVSADGRLDARFSLPNSPDDGANPEQLFTAAWSGCFLSALKDVSARMGAEVPVDPVIDAEVDLLPQSLLENAHPTCPSSKETVKINS
jgi:organic hydroperoxide reductase OsmC/OhrA